MSVQVFQSFEMVMFGIGGTLAVTLPAFVGYNTVEVSDSISVDSELVLYKLDEQSFQSNGIMWNGNFV